MTMFGDTFTDSERDIQIAGSRLCDYLRDLLIVAGHPIAFDDSYQAIRLQFGEAVVQLVQAVRVDAMETK